MKRRTLVQSNSSRRLVAPEPGSGQQPLTSMQQSTWASPISSQGNLDLWRTQSALTTAPAQAAQDPR